MHPVITYQSRILLQVIIDLIGTLHVVVAVRSESLKSSILKYQYLPCGPNSAYTQVEYLSVLFQILGYFACYCIKEILLNIEFVSSHVFLDNCFFLLRTNFKVLNCLELYVTKWLLYLIC